MTQSIKEVIATLGTTELLIEKCNDSDATVDDEIERYPFLWINDTWATDEQHYEFAAWLLNRTNKKNTTYLVCSDDTLYPDDAMIGTKEDFRTELTETWPDLNVDVAIAEMDQF